MQLPKIPIVDWQNPSEGVREWTPPEVPNFAGPIDLATLLISHRAELGELKAQGVGTDDPVGAISNEMLPSLLLHAYRASFRTDEGRTVRPRLFVPECGLGVSLPTMSPSAAVNPSPSGLMAWYQSKMYLVRFENPLPMDDEKPIAKLAAMLQQAGASLVVQEVTGKLVITAIAQLDFKDAQRPVAGMPRDGTQVNGLLIEVQGPGNLRVREGAAEYTLCENRVLAHQSAIWLEPVREWLHEVSRRIVDKVRQEREWISGHLTFPELDADFKVPQLDVKITWSRIIREAIRLGHGGTFVVVPQEPPPPIEIKYRVHALNLGTKISQVWLAECRRAAGREQLDYGVLEEKRLATHNLTSTILSIAALSEVDGCVVLDRNLSVIGFGGTIVPQSKKVDRAKCFHLVRKKEMLASDVLDHLGHRHSSAYGLCRDAINSIAFVISQDGDLRVFANQNGQLCFADGLCP
jgi:hypothetical protein